MASSIDKKKSKDHNHDFDTNSFLAEERRLSKKPVTTHLSEKTIGKLNTRVNRMTPEQIDEELQKKGLSTRGDIDIRRSLLKHQSISELKFGHQNSPPMIEQQFEYIAVVDFEATCEQHQNNYQNEIIEFPIVLINVQQQTIVDQFRSYCRPTINPILSAFCTDLTGIEQHQVDSAPLFIEVFQNVETWLKERNLLTSSDKQKLAFATDGPWDFANFLRLQCQISSMPFPQWARQWINIRKEFAKFYGVRSCGIPKMLGKLHLNFDGRRHSGLDDSINIARITIELLKDGCVLYLNDGLHGDDPKFTALTEGQTEVNNSDEREKEISIVFED